MLVGILHQVTSGLKLSKPLGTKLQLKIALKFHHGYCVFLNLNLEPIFNTFYFSYILGSHIIPRFLNQHKKSKKEKLVTTVIKVQNTVHLTFRGQNDCSCCLR